MTNMIEGKLDARGIKIGIIVSRFNNFTTEKLLSGALEELKSHGGEENDVTVIRVWRIRNTFAGRPDGGQRKIRCAGLFRP